MFEREAGLIRRMVRAKEYVLTYHADDLHDLDIESIVINGFITRREIDQQTQEPKFIFYGPTSQGFDAEVVTKIKGMVVIITVYLL